MRHLHRLVATSRARARRHGRFAPRIDPLETRALLSTIIVNSAGDGTTNLPGVVTLRQAIGEAASGDTIRFAESLHGQTITLTQGVLDVSKNLTIDGPDAGRLAVSGNNSSEVLDVASGVSATVSGLTITGGSATTGGGIFNAGTLTLQGVNVTGNVASNNGFYGGGQGGGIYNTGTLNVDDSTIKDNKAIGTAGSSTSSAGSARGGGIDNQGGTVTLDHTTIQGNSAIGGADANTSGSASGGGIQDVGTLTIRDTTFVDNAAVGGSGLNSTGSGGSAQGGAINSGTSSATVFTLTITNTQFLDNRAAGGTGLFTGNSYGGAIDNQIDGVTISGSSFVGNQALGGYGGTGYFIADGAGAQGGAIDDFVGTLSIAESTFQDNAAIGGAAGTQSPTGSNGGGYAYGGAVDYTGGTYFVNNQNIPVNSVLALTGDSLTANQAIGGEGEGFSGGAAFGGALQVEGGGFIGSFGSGGEIGVGVSSTSPGVTIDRTTISGNIAQGASDAMGFSGGSARGGGVNSDGPLAMTESSVSGNAAIAGAGGAGSTGFGVGGYASGGGLYLTGGSLSDTTVSGNRAVGGAGGSGAAGDAGGFGGSATAGGVELFGGPLTVDNSLVIGNQAVGGAGGQGGVIGASGKAGVGGAGGAASGGGIHAESSNTTSLSLSISGGTISGNLAQSGNGGAGGPGASGGYSGLSVGGGLVIADYLNFQYNFQTGKFTVIQVPAIATVTDTTFLGDQARGGNGGAGLVAGQGGFGGSTEGGAVEIQSDATFNGSGDFFAFDAAIGGSGGSGGSTGTGGAGGNGGGGALYTLPPTTFFGSPLAGGTLNLSDSIVTVNLAQGGNGGMGSTNGADGTGNGGGLFLAPGSVTTLSKDRIFGNRASTSGNDIDGSYNS